MVTGQALLFHKRREVVKNQPKASSKGTADSNPPAASHVRPDAQAPRDGTATADAGAASVRAQPLIPPTLRLVMEERKSKLTSNHVEQLKSLVHGRTSGDWIFEITGYAFERSSRKKNLSLARSRARTIMREIMQMGVPAKAIMVQHLLSVKKGEAGHSVEIKTRPKGSR